MHSKKNTNVQDYIDFKDQALICGKLFRYVRISTKLRKRIIQSHISVNRNQEQLTNQTDTTDNTTANEDTLVDDEAHQNGADTDNTVETAANQNTFDESIGTSCNSIISSLPPSVANNFSEAYYSLGFYFVP